MENTTSNTPEHTWEHPAELYILTNLENQLRKTPGMHIQDLEDSDLEALIELLWIANDILEPRDHEAFNASRARVLTWLQER